jgi:Fe2+ or Zn2+ uptake regulation protein
MPEEEAFTLEKVVTLLRKEGLRITNGRRGILSCLFAASRPLSLQEIQEESGKHGGARPDFATVFRTLSKMESLQLVHKVHLHRACSYFELNDPRKHYDHLVCKTCGQVVLLDIPCTLGNAHREIETRYGFRKISHSLEFFGICPACAS